MKEKIHSDNAPAAIGTYSQAIGCANTVYLSGQIPLDPVSGNLINGNFSQRIQQVIDNLEAVCIAAGGSLQQIVKLNVYLTDLAGFETVNTVMADNFTTPYPARAAIEVSALPKNTDIEMDAVMVTTGANH